MILIHPLGKFLVFDSMYFVPLVKSKLFRIKLKIHIGDVIEEFSVVPVVIKLKYPFEKFADILADYIVDVDLSNFVFEFVKNYDTNDQEKKYIKYVVENVLKNFTHIVDAESVKHLR